MRKMTKLAAAALLLLCGAGTAKAADPVVVHDTVYILQQPPAQGIHIYNDAELALDDPSRCCEYRHVWPVEFEAYVALKSPLLNRDDYKKLVGAELGFQFRIHMRHKPIAISAGLSLESLAWERSEYNNENGGYYWTNTIYTRGLKIFTNGEYVFRRGTKFSPYLGGGVGVLLGSADYVPRDHVYGSDNVVLPYIQARAGVKLLHTLRLSGELTLGDRRISSVGLSLGLVFGGYPCR